MSEVFLIPEDANTVFVVYMKYSDGNSFGSADGKIDILHCCANETAAHDLAKSMQENMGKFSFEIIDDFGREISVSNPASDYFSSCEELVVERFDIEKGRKKVVYDI